MTNTRNLCPNNGTVAAQFGHPFGLERRETRYSRCEMGSHRFGLAAFFRICSLLGFNAFCQILNFTTKYLIMLWHSALGKCAGLESAAVASSQ